MNHSRFRLLARTSVCLALLLALPVSAQSRESKAGDVMTRALPNQPLKKCKSANAVSTAPDCSQTTFEVVVNALKKADGTFAGCAAFFLYRELEIDTKKASGSGADTTLTWRIFTVSGTGAVARFTEPGIRFGSKPGNDKPPPRDLFEEPVISADASMVSVVVKKHRDKKSFDHLPVVQYKDGSVGWTDCGGVDPTISNNPS